MANAISTTKHNRGVTLLECLLSAALLSIGVASLAMSLGAAYDNMIEARFRDAALQAAQAKLEAVCAQIVSTSSSGVMTSDNASSSVTMRNDYNATAATVALAVSVQLRASYNTASSSNGEIAVVNVTATCGTGRSVTLRRYITIDDPPAVSASTATLITPVGTAVAVTQ